MSADVRWFWYRRDSYGDRWYYQENPKPVQPGQSISWTARERESLRYFASKEEAREHIRKFIRSWRHMGYRRRDFVVVKLTRKKVFRSMAEVDRAYFPNVSPIAVLNETTGKEPRTHGGDDDCG